jgi:hypothetical protein
MSVKPFLICTLQLCYGENYVSKCNVEKTTVGFFPFAEYFRWPFLSVGVLVLPHSISI